MRNKDKKNKENKGSFLNKLKKGMHSMSFLMFVLFAGLAIASLIIISAVNMIYYRNVFIDSEKNILQTHVAIVADKIQNNGDINKLISKESEVSNGYTELEGVRIRVLDGNFTVVYDSSGVDIGKTFTEKNVLLSYGSAENKTEYIKDTEEIESVSPLINSNGDIFGTVIINKNISYESLELNNVNKRVVATSIAMGISEICILIIFIFSYKKKLKRYEIILADIARGHVEKRLPPVGYAEYEKMVENVNEILDNASETDEVLGDFVSNASHELKTPMTSMKLLADSLIAQEDVPVEMYREFMIDISNEIDRENQIIEDLLALTRMDKGTSELNISSVDLVKFVENILKKLKPIANKKDVTILFESMKDVVAEVDEIKMSQVITNLVENAIKYNNQGGKVVVSLNADYEYFYLKFEDNGIGIPEEHQKNIFKRFYRVDKARSRETGGTGLGLSIVESIVVKHNGQIKLYSMPAPEGEKNGQTVFSVRIPLKNRK